MTGVAASSSTVVCVEMPLVSTPMSLNCSRASWMASSRSMSNISMLSLTASSNL